MEISSVFSFAHYLLLAALELSSEAAAPILYALFAGLIAVIYRGFDRRLDKCEDQMVLIQEIRADVKIIKSACPVCIEEEEK